MGTRAEQSVHVRVDQPLSKRKEVLTTTISVVEILKKYDRIHTIRKEKEKEFEKFKKAMRSINYLLRRVRLEELPLGQEGLEHVRNVKGKYIIKPKSHAKKKHKKAAKKEVTRSAIDKQLDSLRRKLEKL